MGNTDEEGYEPKKSRIRKYREVQPFRSKAFKVQRIWGDQLMRETGSGSNACQTVGRTPGIQGNLVRQMGFCMFFSLMHNV